MGVSNVKAENVSKKSKKKNQKQNTIKHSIHCFLFSTIIIPVKGISSKDLTATDS